MIETALANPELSELESIFSSIETASKTISNLVRRSSISGLTGYLDSGNINVQGEEQKKLDVITNDVLKNALWFTGRMGVLASEEEDVPVGMPASTFDEPSSGSNTHTYLPVSSSSTSLL